MSAKNSYKILVPLATLAIAGAVAVGSGATWTSSTTSSVSVTSGTIGHTNSKNAVTLNLNNLKPGDVRTSTLVLTNTGSLDSKVSVEETPSGNTFYKDATTGVSDLRLVIKRDGVTVHTGNFGEWAAGAHDVTGADPLNAADGSSTLDETTFTFIVTLDANANDISQNKSAGATYTFVTSPVDGSSATLPWN